MASNNPFGNTPVFKIPPAPSSKKGKGTALDQFIAKHPGLKPYANMIAQWSATYHASPLTVAAIIQFESSGNNQPYNPAVQGAGIAQINPGKAPNQQQWENVVGKKLDPMDPNSAINFLAWNVAAAGNPDAQTFYTTVWNPGFKPTTSRPGPGPLLKGFPAVTATGQTPAQAAAGSAARASAKGQIPYNLNQLRVKYRQEMIDLAVAKGYSQQDAGKMADKALAATAKAKLPPGEELTYLQALYQGDLAGLKSSLTISQLRSKYYTQLVERAVGAGYSRSDAQTVANHALAQTAKAGVPAGSELQFLTTQFSTDLSGFEAGLRAQGKLQTQIVDQFKRTQTDYAPTFLAYAGRQPTPIEIQNIINNGTSKYQVATNLMKSPGFYKSPIWDQNAARYTAYYQAVFGPNVQVPKDAISYAIQHSLDETAFKGMLTHDTLPGQGKYTTSEEYKGLYATYQSAYSNIYGLPDDTGKNMIDQAIRKGWTADQWTQYLRKQPEYTSSGEYKMRSLDLASRMGLVQAPQQTVLSPAPTPGQQMLQAGV